MLKIPSGAAILVLLLGVTDARGADPAGKAPPSTPAPACVEAKPGGPGDVVRALYAAYPFEGTKVVEEEPREVIGQFFEVRLTELFIRERECVRRQGGDLCRLTASLLYQAQDAEIADFRVCASSRGPGWIEVRFRNFGENVVIPYRLTKTPAGWRIADQVFESGGTLVGLLSKPL